MKHNRKVESGQVLVILTVGIIALMGFAALAIDGGMYYADRRYDQNAADNAALAGAAAAGQYMSNQKVNKDDFTCASTDAKVQAAINQASSIAQTSVAEFNIPVYDELEEYNLSNQGVYIDCKNEAGDDGKYLLVKVKLTSITKTSFAQLVFNGDLANTVEAVTRVEPGVNEPSGPSADGAGLVGLAEDCNEGTTMLFNGTVNVTIATGGVHSNSCMTKTGASGYIVTETGSEYRTDFSGKEDPFCIGTSEDDCVQTDPELTDTIVTLEVAEPKCDSLEYKNFNKKDKTIFPGRYTSIIQPNGNLTFAPGLYCLEAGAKFSGNNTLSVSGTSENGITIYVEDGNFSIGGSMKMDLRAPQQGATGSGYAIPGLLLYTADGYDGTISMLGNASSILRGTVFVPDGMLEVGGSSYTSNWSAQMLAKWVKIHGNTTLILQYEDDDLYWDEGETTQPLLDVYQ